MKDIVKVFHKGFEDNVKTAASIIQNEVALLFADGHIDAGIPAPITDPGLKTAFCLVQPE